MRVEELIRSLEAGEALTEAQWSAVRRGELDVDAGERRPAELGRLARHAARHGHVDLITALAASADPAVRASLAAPDEAGMTPAHHAGKVGHADVLTVLSSSADPTVRASLAVPDRRDNTPALWAAQNGHADVFTALGASADPAVRAALAACDGRGRIPAHFAAAKGHVDVITALGACADPAVRCTLAARDGTDRMPVHYAAENGRADVINALVASADPAVRASLTTRDGFGNTPEYLALRSGNPDIADALRTDPLELAEAMVDSETDRMRPDSLALDRAVVDLEKDQSTQARNLLTELQCPVLGMGYTTVGPMRPVYLLKAGEGADAGTPMKPCLSAAAAERIALTVGEGEDYPRNPSSREPFDGHADAQDRIQLLREVAQAYEGHPDNLPAARAEALAAYARHEQGPEAGRAPANASTNAETPAQGAGTVDFREVLARNPPTSPRDGAGPAGAGRGGPQP